MATSTTDLNLLFGMLALQLDFVSRDQLLAGMQTWMLAKDRPLCEILVELKSLAPDQCQLLEALVQKHLEAHGNDAARSLASLSSLSLARETLDNLGDPDIHATLTRSKGLRDDNAAEDFATQPPASDGNGRYRILRPHAKGGLGVVFVARDQEIGREVALKEIQLHRAHDAESRARFVLEAEITGGLEHPGIVPVYGLGHYADGRPFYAMRFIKGDSLKEAAEKFHATEAKERNTDEQSLALRQLLRRFIDVCNAIDYAHSKGVLHRDLKPGNIMLGKFGETLVVDWGLAKIQGRPDIPSDLAETPFKPASASGATPTEMGNAIGTPAFMSPEQAAGRLDLLGPASDVYSLGATLYFVLTGQIPFAKGNMADILDRVRKGEFPRPRQVAGHVPAPLEAVCLKAMSLDPNRRYASAAKFRADIENWISDIPVSAWKEPLAVRARRWLSRHRFATGMAITATVVAVLALAIATGFLSKVNEQLVQAGAREKEQRRRAEDQVVSLFLERGQQAANDGDHFLAALDYVEALARESNPQKATLHRTMLASLLQNTPKVEWIVDAKTPIRHASFSPDGQSIVIAGVDGKARLINRAKGSIMGAPLAHGGAVICTAFSPDGKSVATASADSTARVWNAVTGAPITPPIPHPGPVVQVSFNLAGDTLLTASSSSAPLLWDAATGKPRFERLQLVSFPRNPPVVSGDTKHPTTSPPAAVDPEKPSLEVEQIVVGILDPLQPSLLQAEYVGDKILTVSDDGHVRIVSAARPYEATLFEIVCQPRAVHACLHPERSILIVACEDGTIRAYSDLQPSKNLTAEFKVIDRHLDGATMAVINRSGDRIASAGRNRDAAINKVSSTAKQHDQSWAENPAEYLFVQFSPAQPPSPPFRPKPTSNSNFHPPSNIQVLPPSQRPVGSALDRPGFGTPKAQNTIPINSRPVVVPPVIAPPVVVPPVVKPPKIVPTEVATPIKPELAPNPQPKDLKLPSEQVGVSERLPKPAQPPAPAGSTAGESGEAPAGAGSQGVLSASQQAVLATIGSRLPPTRYVVHHNHTVHRISFDDSGQFVLTASEDQSARLWHADSGEPLTPPLRHEAAVRFAAWACGGSAVLTCGEDGKVRLWNIADSTTWTKTMGLASEVNVAAFAGGGSQFVTACDNGMVQLWNGDTGTPVGPAIEHPGVVRFAAVDAKGLRLATACFDGHLRIWDLRSHKQSMSIRLPAALSKMVAADRGKYLLTACDDGSITLWDLEKGESVVTVRDDESLKVPGLKSEYQGRLRIGVDRTTSRFVSAGMGPNFHVWDARTGKRLRTVVTDNRVIHDLHVSPDGSRCLTAGTGGVCIWDLETGAALTPPMRESGAMYAATFSPDGSKLATAGSDGIARIWDSATGLPLTRALSHERYVHLVRFSSDGRLLLTVCAIYARVWDVATGLPLTPPLRHGDDEIPTAAFNETGTQVVTGGRDGTARIWNLPPPESRTVDELLTTISRSACRHYSDACQLVVGPR